MERRTLGTTGLDVSRIALGTMTFGGQVDEPTASSMIDCCLEHGVNFLDTANAYTGGASETILGNILQGRRDRFVLATKVGIKTGDAPHEQGLSAEAITHAIEESLRRLRTDYVDLYYLHQPDYKVGLEESLAALDRLVQAGKVRFIGASNYASWQVCRMLWLAKENGWQPVQVVQPMYNVIARGIEQEFLPFCKEFGIATVVYNPLAGGLLTNKQKSAKPLAGTRFDRMPVYRDRYWHDVNFEAVEELEAAGREEGITPITLAFAWLLRHSPGDCVLVGASNLNQLRENLAAANQGPLCTETLTACDRVWQKLRGVQPQYNR